MTGNHLASLAPARPRDGARRRSPAATSLALEGLVSPLAGLEDLWDAPIAWDDPPALHERIDACTAQLVDHCQHDPVQILR